MHSVIARIEFHLPQQCVTTADLNLEHPEWSITNIDRRTGISCRHIAARDECASDLAVVAAEKLFHSGVCHPKDIDFLLFCTQSPDFLIPTTACLVHERLGLKASAGAVDINLGCSGFVYGLGMATALISSDQVSTVLLVTADTYSKYISPNDKTCRAIFGDGAATTLVTRSQQTAPTFSNFVYGTKGSGSTSLFLPGSGSRVHHRTPDKHNDHLVMDGARLFSFALEVVPRVINDVLSSSGLSVDDIALFVCHQANAYMLDVLRERIGVAKERFYICLSDSGNTVSSTIPIALKQISSQNRLKPGDLLLLIGFGVGYSWASTIMTWTGRL